LIEKTKNIKLKTTKKQKYKNTSRTTDDFIIEVVQQFQFLIFNGKPTCLNIV
jgi:hypothetical protein